MHLRRTVNVTDPNFSFRRQQRLSLDFSCALQFECVWCSFYNEMKRKREETVCAVIEFQNVLYHLSTITHSLATKTFSRWHKKNKFRTLQKLLETQIECWIFFVFFSNFSQNMITTMMRKWKEMEKPYKLLHLRFEREAIAWQWFDKSAHKNIPSPSNVQTEMLWLSISKILFSVINSRNLSALFCGG